MQWAVHSVKREELAGNPAVPRMLWKNQFKSCHTTLYSKKDIASICTIQCIQGEENDLE